MPYNNRSNDPPYLLLQQNISNESFRALIDNPLPCRNISDTGSIIQTPKDPAIPKSVISNHRFFNESSEISVEESVDATNESIEVPFLLAPCFADPDNSGVTSPNDNDALEIEAMGISQ